MGSEFWWRTHDSHDEFSRKFVHITVGSFVAFWPFYLSWGQIMFLSLAFLVVISISKYLRIFRAIHSVQRATWGELFFAAAVGLCAVITHNKWIYLAAVLQMSLADGLAAVLGVRYGSSNGYKVLGYSKSIVGSTTFFVVSCAILIAFSHFSHLPLGAIQVLALAGFATIIENIGIQGLDNVLVPVAVALSLKFIV